VVALALAVVAGLAVPRGTSAQPAASEATAPEASAAVAAGPDAAARPAAPDAAARDSAEDVPEASPVPAAVAREVRGAVAARWGVPAGDVRLEWGPTPVAVEGGGALEVHLAGSGRSGYWVAMVESYGERAGAVRVRASHRTRVPVAARRLAREDTLDAESITVEERFRYGPPVDAGDRVQPGWVTRRPVEPGERLRPPAVAPPDVVRSGHPVDVVWSRGRVRLVVTGTALGHAALGEEVPVRLHTDRRMRGRATGQGEVTLTGGGR
jgi:flagella basal body P-ring formation protein FlgA